MTATARVLAQAKVNLLLRILAREDSGYHQIETIFQRLDLGDDVTVLAGGRTRSLDCDETELPLRGRLGPPEQNLAYRAAEAFQAVTQWPTGWRIEIRKRIPVGGGLGGGSADAGAVLRALNALAPAPVAPDALARIAASLGSDVPFLTSESVLAIGRGRGERLEPMRVLPVRDVALAVFSFGVSTRDAYAQLAASRAGQPGRPPTMSAPSATTWSDVASMASNDFEPIVASAHPPIAEALRALRRAGAKPAMLCGSGATVFGVFEERVPVVLGDAARVVWTRTSNSVVAVERMG